MIEKDMQTIFGKYVRSHPPDIAEVYELKICKGTSLPFNALAKHQEQALLQVKLGFFHKLSDPPIWSKMNQTRFNIPRPFDCMFLTGIQAYVVIWYYHPRKVKVFIKIPVLIFLKEREISTRKSLTEQRAKELGTLIMI